MFQTINALLFSKKDEFACEDYETLQAFQPFMVNRWSSFYNKDIAVLVNSTFNKYSQIFDDKSRTFRMYHHLMPKLGFKRIQYAKKTKIEKTTEVEHLELFASHNCVSVRELKDSIAFYNQYCK